MAEEWKVIDGYNNNYSISNKGNVKNNNTNKILKQAVNRGGYNKLCLSVNGKKKTELIHRLVALAFIPNPENKPHVDHINNNKIDNNVNNLRWATAKENQYNQKLSKANKCGVKGVCYNKRDKKWRASITVDGIKIHIGSFDTMEEAKQARIKRANKAFGVFINACEKEEEPLT